MDEEILDRLRGAAEIVALLEQHGEVMTDERPVELFFYGESESLDKLSADDALSGYELRQLDDPEGMAATRVVVVDGEWVARTAHDMVKAAHKYGVEYDGWEAGLVRQGN